MLPKVRLFDSNSQQSDKHILLSFQFQAIQSAVLHAMVDGGILVCARRAEKRATMDCSRVLFGREDEETLIVRFLPRFVSVKRER
jgi:hypothetical protein